MEEILEFTANTMTYIRPIYILYLYYLNRVYQKNIYSRSHKSLHSLKALWLILTRMGLIFSQTPGYFST